MAEDKLFEKTKSDVKSSQQMNESNNNNDTKDETAYKNNQPRLSNEEESSKQTLHDRDHDVSKKQSDSTSKGQKKGVNK